MEATCLPGGCETPSLTFFIIFPVQPIDPCVGRKRARNLFLKQHCRSPIRNSWIHDIGAWYGFTIMNCPQDICNFSLIFFF